MKTIVRQMFVLLLGIFAVSCVTLPDYSPIRGDKFSASTLMVERLYVVVNFPASDQSTIAIPLMESLREHIQTLGAQVQSEVRPINPLALGSGIDFTGARQYKPQAILLVRMSESGHGSGYSYRDMTFDLIDAQGRGIWRGRSTLSRWRAIKMTTDALSRDLLKKLLEDSILEIKEAKK